MAVTRLGSAATAILRAMLGLALGLVLATVLAAGGLVLRLMAGPIDVTWLARQTVAIAAPEDGIASASFALESAAGERVMHLVLTGLEQQGDEGLPPVTIRHADLTLSVSRLLRGEVAPRTATADGLRLHLRRRADGAAGSGSGPGIDVSGLTTLRLTDTQVNVDDAALGKSWQVTVPRLEASQDADGTLRGHGGLQARVGAMAVSATLDLTRKAGQVSLHAAVQPFSPAGLAAIDPALAPAAALDAPVTAVVDAELGPNGELLRGHLRAEAEAGAVQVPMDKGGTTPFAFSHADLDIEGDATAATIHSSHLVLAPPSGSPPTHVTVGGAVSRTASQLRMQLTLDLDRANFADLPAVWPEGTGGGARPWLTENMTAGTAHDGHFTATLLGKPDGSDITLTAAGGTLAADDVTAWWLRPVPPIEHGHADLVLQSPDALLITVRDGAVGKIVLRGGTLRITGLLADEQPAVIQADLASPLADVLTLLRHPRLELLSKRPFPVAKPSGAVLTHLTVNLPLDDKVDIDQVAIHAQIKVAGAHLGGVVAGRDLNNANLSIDVTNSGLTATGAGLLDRVPAKFDVAMDFNDGPASQVNQHVTASLRGTERELAASGLDPGGVLAGTLAATVDYAERRDGRATVKVEADLRDAALTTPFGWDKPAGSTGHATVEARLDHGRVVEVSTLQAEAPGLSVAGQSEMQAGEPSVLHIDRAVIGRTSTRGTVGLPQHANEPYRINLSGPRLDLTSLTQPPKPGGAKPASERGPAYVLDLRFDRVLVGGARGLGPVSLQADGDGQRVRWAHLVSNGPELLRVDLRAAPGGRHLVASAGDLGALLREAKLAEEVNGGVMAVDAAYDDRAAGSPLAGTFELGQFKVQGAPVVGKVLQGLTLYGLVDALRGPGLVFDRLATPFQLTGNVLDVTDARAYSSSLGLTAKGQLDFGRGVVALTGTVVPAYFFNSLPGRIPLVGRLFSPEKGGGLFAARYGLTGKINDPSLSLNPLSTLTPGALRGVFDLFK